MLRKFLAVGLFACLAIHAGAAVLPDRPHAAAIRGSFSDETLRGATGDWKRSHEITTQFLFESGYAIPDQLFISENMISGTGVIELTHLSVPVPEPTGLGLMALGVLGMLQRLKK